MKAPHSKRKFFVDVNDPKGGRVRLEIEAGKMTTNHSDLGKAVVKLMVNLMVSEAATRTAEPAGGAPE